MISYLDLYVANGWKPSDYAFLIVATTGSLALLILVCGVVWGVLNGSRLITPEILGSTKGAAIGSGLLGFMACLTTILVPIVKKDGRKERSKSK
jgi:hypothetical protein